MGRFHLVTDCSTGDVIEVPYTIEEEAAADALPAEPPALVDDPVAALQRQVDTLTAELAKATTIAAVRTAAQAAAGA